MFLLPYSRVTVSLGWGFDSRLHIGAVQLPMRVGFKSDQQWVTPAATLFTIALLHHQHNLFSDRLRFVDGFWVFSLTTESMFFLYYETI